MDALLRSTSTRSACSLVLHMISDAGGAPAVFVARGLYCRLQRHQPLGAVPFACGLTLAYNGFTGGPRTHVGEAA